jgi:2-polyprenyl-3-methyl-5-hydroxy-6-metoxy-1,4-benzoquinol methylase
MDIGDLGSAAARFRTRLDRVKAENQAPGLSWYPYDSFSLFPVLFPMLREERRDLLGLAGAAPLLDLGCGDGDLSFFFESLGCPVVAIDNWNPNFNQTRGFQALHRALASSVEFRMHDLDAGPDLSGRTFGLALCLGVLYHLKNPYGFLEALARHARHCLLSTRIAQVTPRGKSMSEEPLAYLVAPMETNQDASNYWIFSEAGLVQLLDRTGWELCDYTTTGCTKRSDPVRRERDQRAFCLIRSRLADPWTEFELDGGWHELEEASWRWTQRVFRVRLKVTAQARVALRFRFRVPEAVGNAILPVRLHATVGQERLPACVYDSPGEHVYEQCWPAAAGSGVVPIRFELDRALAPTGADRRELGVQVIFWSYDGAAPRAVNAIELCETTAPRP